MKKVNTETNIQRKKNKKKEDVLRFGRREFISMCVFLPLSDIPRKLNDEDNVLNESMSFHHILQTYWVL